MHQKNITVPKTARYFILGEAGKEIESVWFVCHGYGQLASQFLKKFLVLENGKNLIIAPEGLHRFYWEKFSGRVVASWMTKEDREEDILDYVNYLEMVYEEVMQMLAHRPVRIIMVGFSQGTSTVCRWITSKKRSFDSLVLWAGSVPPELEFSKEQFAAIKMHYVVGDNDEFIKEEQLRSLKEVLSSKGLSFEMHQFKGKHEINEEMLIKLAEKM